MTVPFLYFIDSTGIEPTIFNVVSAKASEHIGFLPAIIVSISPLWYKKNCLYKGYIALVYVPAI